MAQGRFTGQGRQTLLGKIEVLCDPGAKKRGQTHARLRGLKATRSTTDFVGDHQGTNVAQHRIESVLAEGLAY